MKRYLILFISCIALSGCAARPVSPAASAKKDTNAQTVPRKSGSHNITIDGRSRTFILDVPKGLKKGAPLVMVFHGYTDSAKAIRRYSSFTPLIEKYGFVAVYPQGTRDKKGKTFFNVGYGFHKDAKVDDVKFARELAAQLVKDLDLDPNSIFATGMSNGGDMCYLLALQPDPFIKAYAPVAGCMLTPWLNDLSPKTRTSIMAMHGTHDKITLWDGDPENHYGWGSYIGTEEVINFWTKKLSLEKSEVTELPDIKSRKKTLGLSLHHWQTSKDDEEVLLYKIQGGGHTWPNNLGNKELSTANEIWNFFQRHRSSASRR